MQTNRCYRVFSILNTPMNDKLYLFAFVSPTSNFDNPKNIEIKDHLIKSKFIGDNTTTKTCLCIIYYLYN